MHWRKSIVGGVKWTLKPPFNAQIRLTELFAKGEIKKETSATAAWLSKVCKSAKKRKKEDVW